MTGNAVWMDVLPSLKNFAGDLSKQATTAAAKAGADAGKRFSSSLATGSKGGAGADALVKEVQAAATRIDKIVKSEKANIQQARAAEKVATLQAAAAETSLGERRTQQAAATVRVQRAEAALTAARETHGVASKQAAAAEDQLSAAQARSQASSASLLRQESQVVSTRARSDAAGLKTVAVEDQLRAAFTERATISKQLVEAQDIAERSSRSLGTGLFHLADAGAPVAGGLSKITDGIGRATRSALDAVRPMASLALGIGGIAAVAGVFSLGNEYTTTMSEFQAVTSSTDQVMQQVRQTSRDLGSDLTLPATSGKDAAAVMVELAKGGLSADSAMQAAKGTIQLAAAAQIEGAQAAEIQAAALNQFGLGADQAARVADILANTANAAAGGVEEMGLGLKYVGPTARALGIDINATASSIGLLANNGIKGENAGTALRGMLASLAAPSAQAKTALSDLGVQAFDASGNFVGMRSVIDQLSAAQGRMTKEQFTSAAAIAFGREPLSAVTALAASGATAYDDMAAAVARQGGAADVAAARTAGLAGAQDKLVSQFEDVALSVYETVAPAITSGVTAIASGLDGAGAKISSFLTTAGALGSLVIAGDFTGGLTDGLGWTEDSIPVDMILDARDRVVGAFTDIWSFVTTSLVPSLQNVGTAVLPLAVIIGGAFLTGFQLVGALLRDVVGPALVAVTGWMAENQWAVIALAAVLGTLTAAFYAQKAVMAVQGAGGILAYAKGISVVRTATALWAAGQWALNAAMSANPVGLIVLAIAALVAGVILAYNNIGWFRDGVNAAFAGIQTAITWLGDAATWLWENAFKPAWDAIATAATWLYETILKPAFDGIAAAVRFVGDYVTAYVGVWVTIFQAVAAAGTWLWQNVLAPVFTGIAASVSWAWSVVSAVFDLFVHVVQFVLGAVFTWLYETIIRPVFDGIGWLISTWWTGAQIIFQAAATFLRDTVGAAFSWLYDSVISPVFDWISTKVSAWWLGTQIIFSAVTTYLRDTLGAAFTWLWTSVISPVWDWISSKISDVWTTYVKPVFDALAGFVQDTLPKAFETGKTAIGVAWDGLKDLVKKPIEFVVNTVINDGIIGNFNKLADFFGSKKIDPLVLPKGFARGGVIPGYQATKRDDVMTPMRRGEGVLVPEVVRALGPGTIHALNAAGNRGGAPAVRSLTGGYAEGGIVGDVVSGAIDWVGNAANTAMSFASDPAGSMAKVVDGVIDKIPGAGGMLDLAAGLSRKVVGAAVDKIKSLLGELGPGATGENGRLPVGSLAKVPFAHPGPGVGTYGSYLRRDAAAALIAANSAARAATGQSLSLTEGYRDLAGQQLRWGMYKSGSGNLAATPGTSNHGFGLAADLGASGRAWLASNGPAFGWYPTGLGFSQREPWHFDYKGKAKGYALGGVLGEDSPMLYDNGGILNRGVSLVENRTRLPEYVLPEGRLIDIVEQAGGGSDSPLVGSLTVVSHGDTRDDIDEVNHELRKLRRGGRR